MSVSAKPFSFFGSFSLPPCCQSCLQRTVEGHETLTSVCLFTRPHRPTGRTNRGPSLKPVRRHDHNAPLEEKKTSELAAVGCVFHRRVLIECVLSAMSHMRSLQWYVDLRWDVQSVSCTMSRSGDDNSKACLFTFTVCWVPRERKNTQGSKGLFWLVKCFSMFG